MRTRTVPVLLALCLIAAIAALSAAPGRGEGPAPSPNLPYPVEMTVGETFEVCKSGQILCPAVAPICDDPKVVTPVDTPSGLGFKAVGPGTTLCSAGSQWGIRRVFRFTVLPARGQGDR